MATYSNRTHQRNARLIKVADMLLLGNTQTEIAVHFKLSNATIHNDVKEVKKRWLAESRDTIAEFVATEGGRIDLIIKGLMVKAKTGKLQVIDRLCKLIELKMKLYGLDAKYLSENLRMIMADGANSNQDVGAISQGLRELEAVIDSGEGGGNGNGASVSVPTLN